MVDRLNVAVTRRDPVRGDSPAPAVAVAVCVRDVRDRRRTSVARTPPFAPRDVPCTLNVLAAALASA